MTRERLPYWFGFAALAGLLNADIWIGIRLFAAHAIALALFCALAAIIGAYLGIFTLMAAAGIYQWCAVCHQHFATRPDGDGPWTCYRCRWLPLTPEDAP